MQPVRARTHSGNQTTSTQQQATNPFGNAPPRWGVCVREGESKIRIRTFRVPLAYTVDRAGIEKSESSNKLITRCWKP